MIYKIMREKMQHFFTKFQEDEIFTRSAALSYYASLAIAPLIVLMMIVLGLLDFDFQIELIDTVNRTIGEKAGGILTSAIEAASAKPFTLSLSGLISFILLSASASIIFRELQTTLNKIFEIQVKEDEEMSLLDTIKSIVTDRALAIFMVFVSILIIMGSIIASIIINYFKGKADIWYFEYSQMLVSFLTLNLLFTLMLRVLPQRKISYRKAFYGGVIITIFFTVGKTLIGKYLGQAAVGSAYGAAGSLAVLLVWFYYSSLIVFLGAEIAHFFVIDRSYVKK